MDKRRDGGWAFHCIRKPNKKWELCTFPHTAAEDSHARNKEQPAAVAHGPPIIDAAGYLAGTVWRICGVIDSDLRDLVLG